MRFLGVALCVLLLSVGCSFSSNRQEHARQQDTARTGSHSGKKNELGNEPRAKEGSRAAKATESASGGATSEGSPLRSKALVGLRRGLREVAASSGDRVGIAVEGLDGPYRGRKVLVSGDRVFESASLIKVLVLAELLREVDEGKVSLDEPLGGSTVRRLAESMITVSDNAATNLLIDRIGFGNVNALARELGLEHTVLERHMLDFEARARGEDNYTTASDTATLLADIWRGTFLSPASRRFALDALEGQQLNSKIPAALPPGTLVAHKTGELEGNEHDAGIVVLPKRTFVVAVLTQGDPTTGVATIRKETALTFETFSQPAQSP